MSVGIDRVDAVDSRPEVEGLLRRGIASLGYGERREEDAEGLEHLTGLW